MPRTIKALSWFDSPQKKKNLFFALGPSSSAKKLSDGAGIVKATWRWLWVSTLMQAYRI